MRNPAHSDLGLCVSLYLRRVNHDSDSNLETSQWPAGADCVLVQGFWFLSAPLDWREQAGTSKESLACSQTQRPSTEQI